MRVAMLVEGLYMGGTETYVLSLAESLKKRGVGVIVIAGYGRLTNIFRKKGIPVVTIPFRAESGWRSSMAVAKEVIPIIQRQKIDVIHAHLMKAIHVARVIHQQIGMPYIVSAHGTFDGARSMRDNVRSAARVIAVSPGIADWLHRVARVPKQKIVVISNGIDLDKFSPSKRSRVTKSPSIVYASRLEGEKARLAIRFLETVPLLSTRHRGLRVNVVGPGYDARRVRAAAARINKKIGRKTIDVSGPSYNMPTVYHNADVVVGTGRVAMEAMSCGRPVVAVGAACYVGSVTSNTLERALWDHFGDHCRGPRVKTDRLAADVSRLLNMSDIEKNRMSQFLRKAAIDRFSIARTAAQVSGIYRRVLS